MAPSITDIILFFTGIVSIFLYFLFLLTLRKFRKKQPFNSPFFTIFISVGVADIFMMIVKYGTFSLPRWGWLPFSLIHWPPHFMYFRIGYFVYFYLQYCQYIGSLYLAWNRYSAIVHPTDYSSKWHPQFLKKLLLIQWLIPIFVPVPTLFLNVTANITSEEDGALDPQLEYPAILLYIVGNAIVGLICVVLIFRFYLTAFYKIWKHEQQVHATSTNTDRSRKFEIKLAINGFLIFILLFLYVSFFWIVLLSRSKGRTFRVMFEVFGDLYCWNSVFVMLALNRKSRQHFVAFITCSNVVTEISHSSQRKN